MNITLQVSSYYEYFLSILGWIMNNRAWSLLLDTGLFALPFVFSIIGLFTKAREQGADEGNKGVLLLAWLENYFYMSIFLLFITCVPVFKVNFDIMHNKYDSDCGALRNQPAPKDTAMGKSFTQSSLNGQQAKMPLWWAFTYTVGRGFTQGMINAIPCKPDLRQLQFEVNNVRIKDQGLKNEVAAFNQQCYLPAKARFEREHGTNKVLKLAESSDLEWAGSKILLDGYYQDFHAEKPIKRFPYKQSRDEGFPNTGNGGYPTCKEWWSHSNKGLKAKLIKEYDPDAFDKFTGFLKSAFHAGNDADDMMVKSLIEPTKMTVSNGEHVYGTPLGQDFSTTGSVSPQAIGDTVSKGVSALSGVVGSMLLKPGIDAMKYSLPMIQALISFILIVLTPLIIVMGSYKIKPIIVLTFAQLGVWFMSFIWRLVEWIDSWLFMSMYQSSTHSNWNPFVGVQNNVGDSFFTIVIGMMYLVMPSILFVSMGWTGVQIGRIMEGAVDKAGTKAQQNGDNTTNMAKDVATKGATKGK